jgi:hypothetical protein
MNKATATKVLREVQAYVGDTDPNYGPQLMDHNHEGLSKGSWSICYEGGGPESWACSFESKVPGVFVEPIMGCILGVFNA